ncbi:NADH-ubiquinone oxidoreductase 30.4 kDa subunit [Colletotrichum fioriniae PJ7]|uniref:NADH-ubiquinone oxidoreductase 30.4 kDa subunit n=1 Tax=Colletotrichum fioriniae PJ7 TaxID=1445577 RepID=A0A010RFU9_9PEZI|nr:NADH-ubiquinone oxidoreductase 30.4 kDa subunit [Colletotrichum fioriniae PJ7]
MVKRKRSREDDLEAKLADFKKEIFRAIKGAKGLERQRYSKRLRDDKASPDKVRRLEREILVLKSLDLQQTADAHLHSSLLKIKQIAESPALPEEIKQGVPKPDLSEEEKAALHNVTSGLFNRPHVREAVDKAVRGVCLILNVPIPDKKSKKGKKDSAAAAESKKQEKKDDDDDEPRESKKTKLVDAKDVSAKPKAESKSKAAEVDAEAEEEEPNPFDEMDDEIPTDSDASDGGKKADAADGEEEVDSDEEEEEKALSKMEAMLGGSDSEEESPDEDLKARYKALLGEVADEGDTADDESNSDDEDEDEDEEMADLDDEAEDSGNDSDRQRRINAANVSLSPEPEPSSSKEKKIKRAKKPTGRPGETTFLPSLMGGYISNSESEASDLDLAPPKKRLGQKQRQAIWEKKYGASANHVKKQANGQRGAGGARDSGWDMRKGAVGADEDGGARKPWKKGVSNPLGGGGGKGRDRGGRGEEKKKARMPPKKDDEGILHPSWEARKKAKEAQTTAAFTGTKITF